VAQQKTLALTLGYFGERTADFGLVFPSDEVVGWAAESAFEWLFESADAFQTRLGSFGGTQAIKSQIEADSPQPGTYFMVRPGLQCRVFRELEKRLLKAVLGFHAVAEDAINQAEELGIELGEERVETRPLQGCWFGGGLTAGQLGQFQHALLRAVLRLVVAIHQQNTTIGRFCDTRGWRPNSAEVSRSSKGSHSHVSAQDQAPLTPVTVRR
jgi:hypothetical protein